MAANLTAIVGGVLVFRETIGVDSLAIIPGVAALSLVIWGVALAPAPVRTMSMSAAVRGWVDREHARGRCIRVKLGLDRPLS